MNKVTLAVVLDKNAEYVPVPGTKYVVGKTEEGEEVEVTLKDPFIGLQNKFHEKRFSLKDEHKEYFERVDAVGILMNDLRNTDGVNIEPKLEKLTELTNALDRERARMNVYPDVEMAKVVTNGQWPAIERTYAKVASRITRDFRIAAGETGNGQ